MKMSLRALGLAMKHVHSSPNPVVNCDSSVDILRHNDGKRKYTGDNTSTTAVSEFAEVNH